jgi:histidyl-tRNA synthetase
MAVQKPSVPKGTRDFSPLEMSRRNFIFDIIKGVFQKYGFLQIETPAMENLSTLMGKYGEEGDKLLYKILNSGDFLKGLSMEEVKISSIGKITSQIAKRGLRYDLTVPFARYVVQHRNEITLPFKRFQIQPVWRADNPQKGRYREFYQCDADIIGSKSLLNEFELIRIIDEVFGLLSLDVAIKINNRKILAGISEIIGEKDRIVEITIALDKMDKIGKVKVHEELLLKGISEQALELLEPVFKMSGNTEEIISSLRAYLGSSTIGLEGLDEIVQVLNYLNADPVSSKVELDLTLARGLNYYTGAIIEVKSEEVSIGSVCGGGRYDNLTGIFGLDDVSGVGISFGADRIYDVLLQLDRFPSSAEKHTELLFVNIGTMEVEYILPILSKLRSKGLNAELYPDEVKLKKQMSYADQCKIPFVAKVGESEIKAGKVDIKNMLSGEQNLVAVEELFSVIRA